MSSSNPPTSPSTLYPVSIWEGFGIAMGAVVLVVVALMGLTHKAVRNSTDPERARAIAQSIMSYDIPGGSQGEFGLNIGSVKMAVVSSADSTTTDQVELLLARTPIESRARLGYADGESDFSLLSMPGFSISYDIDGEFQATATREEPRALCNVITPVTVSEGTALLPGAVVPIAAVRYEATAVLDEQRHLVVLMSVGEHASITASEVFNSLNCR
ncbi:hypothetical protein ACQ4M4_10130 [Leptolyngbya sp. AN02str]|uniref:hypothetical protein n=1 Tax=Leptolyngbya sp. AN02str TaxID=3423363 RepID=UPI003D3150F9